MPGGGLKANPIISGKSRFVKYYDLARSIILFGFLLCCGLVSETQQARNVGVSPVLLNFLKMCWAFSPEACEVSSIYFRTWNWNVARISRFAVETLASYDFRETSPKRLARWLVGCSPFNQSAPFLLHPVWRVQLPAPPEVALLLESCRIQLIRGLDWMAGTGEEVWRLGNDMCYPVDGPNSCGSPWGRKLKVSYKESLIDQKWYRIWFIKSKCISTYWDGKSNLRQSFWLINNESTQLNSTWSKGLEAGDEHIRPIQHSWLERCEIPSGWVSCSKCSGCRRWSVLSVPVMMIVNCCWSRIPQSWGGRCVFFLSYFFPQPWQRNDFGCFTRLTKMNNL